MKTLYDIPAPAKINLFLHVVGRRDDGYHLLQTVFRFIDLQDTLQADVRADGEISRSYDLPGVSPEQDIVLRAARLLQAETGTSLGAHLGLDKRIPMGGGLGGGSSDAASVLVALNRLWDTGLDRSQLMQLGLRLGADVPVFIFGQNAFAEGVGEELQPLTLPQAAYVIVQPCASVATVDIFSAKELTRDTKPVRITDFPAAEIDFLLQPPQEVRQFGHNDLQPVVYSRYPVVSQAAKWLSGLGVEVRMSGSGACLFAGYHDLQNAVLAKQEIVATMRTAGSEAIRLINSVHACAGLVEHPLRHWVTR